MKRWVVNVLTVVAIIILSVVIYESKGVQKTAVNSEKIIITIWTKDRHDAQFQQEKIAEYNRNNQDNIQVDYKMFGENYVQAVYNAFDNGKAPDLMVYTSDIFYPNVDEGRFADIAPYMDEAFLSTFSDVMVEGLNVRDGKCYFIPTTISTSKLFYNKTIFERVGIKEPPRTMEELVADAKIITDKLSNEGIYGFAANLNNAQSALARSLMKQARMNTGIQNGFDFSKGEYDFTSYQGIIEAWRELMSPQCAYPNTKQLDIDPLRQLFAQGKIGMYISYLNAEISIYKTQFKMTDEWGYVEIPTIKGEKIMHQNCALNNGYLFNANSEHLDEAWKVYREIFGNVDNLTAYYMQDLGTSIIEEVIVKAEEQGYHTHEDMLSVKEYEKIWPAAPHEMNPEAIAVEGMDMYETFKMLIYGESDISKALKDLNKRYNKAYEQAITAGLAEDLRQ